VGRADGFGGDLTLGSVPSVYYGDEIGMRYLTGLPDREGSVWTPAFKRAGCRTPMQWDGAEPNAGFSTAAGDELYLPIDPDPGRPTVADQRAREQSTLNQVRRLIQLRRQIPDLRPGSPTDVLVPDYPLVYRRGERYLVVVNPAGMPRTVQVPELRSHGHQGLEVSGLALDDDIRASPFGYGIFRLDPPGRA
jgi:glycosidase